MNIYTMLSSIAHSSLYLYLSTTMLARTNMSSILHQKKINRQEVSYPRTNSKERKHYRDVLRSTISEEFDCFLTHCYGYIVYGRVFNPKFQQFLRLSS